MRVTKWAVTLCALGLLAICAGLLRAQTFPNKVMRIITGEPGGGTDFQSRLIAQVLTANLGQQVIVENRGGGSGAISVHAVSKAAPDGHTLLLNSGNIWILPLLQPGVGYDPLRDMAPVMFLARQPSILVVHPALPVKSVKDLIALGRSRPGALNYAAGSSGSSTHLSAELFNYMTGSRMVRISYKGTGPAVMDLLAGQVQVMFASASSVTQHMKAGRVRALAVTTAEPSPLVPGLPSISAAGLPGYESVASYGIFAPPKTPEALIARLNQELKRAVGTPEVRDRITQSGLEILGSSPDELAHAVSSDIAKWGKVIKSLNIRAD